MALQLTQVQGQNFGASGANHSGGLVPDPGSVAGTGRFLREDSTFATVSFASVSGTVAVSAGGTGDSSLTPFAVLCGGTVSISAVQPVASLGATGFPLLSNGAGSLPSFRAVTVPTVQSFTSAATTTYTPANNIIWIRVRMCGPGGGGGANATNNGSAGSTSTSFGSWTAVAGNGGANGGSTTGASAGGTGGTGGTNGTGTLVLRVAGGGGSHGGADGAAGTRPAAGMGGVNPFGGCGGTAAQSTGYNGAANTGAGGGGGGGNEDVAGGAGGGAGEYVEFYMTAAQVGASQTCIVGAGGTGGAAGTKAGGNGGSGVIVVEEHYI
jgi:hypothetical protein